MKKTLLFVLVILASLTVRSQTLKDYMQTADSCFSNLNKSGITTGILYDRIYPLAALAIFNENYADTSHRWSGFTIPSFELRIFNPLPNPQ